MTEHMEQTELTRVVRELLAEPEIRRAVETSATTFWDILEYGDDAGEIRYSRFLCWLLNPSKDHGLGAQVAEALLAWAGRSVAPLTAISTRAEWQDVDVVLTARDAVLAIENKTKTGEHVVAGTEVMQTEEYAARLAELPGSERLYLFLTPDGHSPHDNRWVAISYAQLGDVLEEIARGVADPRVRSLIDDFVSSTRRRFNPALSSRLEAYFPHRLSRQLSRAERSMREDLARMVVDRELADPRYIGSIFMRRLVASVADAESENRQTYLALADAVTDLIGAEGLDRLLLMTLQNLPSVNIQTSTTDPLVQDAVERLARELQTPDNAERLAALGIPQPVVSGPPRQSLYFQIDGERYFLGGTHDGVFPRPGDRNNLCADGLVERARVEQWSGDLIRSLADELLVALERIPSLATSYAGSDGARA